MKAQLVLTHAAAAGIRVDVEGSDLVLEATGGQVPTDLIAEARAHKPELLELLRSWDADDYRALYEERAGIIEHDGVLPRAEAEARAFEYCIVEWLNRHPVPSPTGRCAACDKGETTGVVVVPYGIGPHVWLHTECWPAWHDERRAKAAKALNTLGIHLHD